MKVEQPGVTAFTELSDAPNSYLGAANDHLVVNALETAIDFVPGGGGGGTVDTVVAGTGISVDSTDPANPIVSSTITQYTDEMAQDAVGAMVDTTLVYTDSTPLLSRAALTGAITASSGSNATLLGSFTLSQLNTALSDADVATGGGTVTGTSSGTNTGDQTITLTSDVTGSGTGSFATTIANNAVTLAKMATVATDSILGRATAATGNVEVLTALPFAYTGDVTRPADSNTTTIASAAVTYAKIQNLAANTFLANATGSAATVQEIATSRIPLFSSAITGTPSSTTFLRGDGTWTAPSGSGDVVGPASAVNNNVVLFDGTTGKLIKDSGLALSGTNTGDVTLAGTPDYLTIAGQVITRGLIDLATDITGDLPFANLTQATAASKLLGRGSSGAGDYQEITLGTNLSMSGTTLNATGGGGSGLSRGLVLAQTQNIVTV